MLNRMKTGEKKYTWIRLTFKRSGSVGLLYQLVVYGVKLLVGVLLSRILSRAMKGSYAETLQLAGITLGILAVSALPLYMLNCVYLRARASDGQRFREVLYEKILDRRILVRNKGEMEVKLRRDTEVIAEFFSKVYPKAVGGLFIMVGSAVLLCLVNWKVGILFFAMNLLQLLPILIYEKWMRKIHMETCEAEAEYSQWILTGYEGAHVLKSYDARDWYLEHFHKVAKEVMNWGIRAEGASTVEMVVFQAIDSILNYGGYVILGLFVFFGQADMEDVPLMVILAGYLFSSISSVFLMWLQAAECGAACERLQGNYLSGKLIAGGGIGKGQSLQPENTILVCKSVAKSFGTKLVLQNVNLEIHEGERILLQGENGSGKSTLLRILLGFEDADSGYMKSGISKNLISYALQEEPQTSLTIREISACWEKFSWMDLEAFYSHLHWFRMDDCMEEPLNQLSEGQLKRFFLSAALAKHSRLLILDEPTNHLDTESVCYLNGQLKAYTGALLVCCHNSCLEVSWDRVISVSPLQTEVV